MNKHLKTALAALLIVASIVGIAWAAMRAHDQTTAVSLISADVRAATYTSNDIDVRPYQGQGKIILDAEAQGASAGNTVVVQQSALYTGESVTYAGDANLDLNLATAGTPSVAVVFTQGSATAQVKHIDLQLKRTGTITGTKLLTVTLHSTMSTTPNLTVLATASTYTANDVSATNFQPVRFTLTTPYQLSASTNYWVMLQGDYAASDANYVSWRVATVATLGTAATTTNGSTWTAVTTKRPLMKALEYRFADEVTFNQVANTASFQSRGINLDSVGGYLRSVATISGTSTGAYSLILVAPKQN